MAFQQERTSDDLEDDRPFFFFFLECGGKNTLFCGFSEKHFQEMTREESESDNFFFFFK